MIHDAVDRFSGFALSMILHSIVLAALIAPTLLPSRAPLHVGEAAVSVFVPRPGAHAVPSDPIPCNAVPCGRREPGRPGTDPAHYEAPQLDFLDDIGHELLPALRRAGGAVAIVSPSDRRRTLALYRLADGVNLGAGLDIQAYPLRLVVHNPAAYPQIEEWIGALRHAEQPLRVVALFPADAQARLHAAVEAEAARHRLPIGRRRATVAVSSATVFGIEIRSVETLKRDPPTSG